MVDQRAVDVEPDQQTIPGQGDEVLLEPSAGRIAIGELSGGVHAAESVTGI